MSYILDALRRAQADRERGQVPGLHAQPGLAGAHRARGAARVATAARPAWIWALAGAGGLALLVLLLWWALRAPVVPAAADALPSVQSAPAPAPAPAPATVQPAPPPPPPPPLVVVSALPAPKSALNSSAGAAINPATKPLAQPATKPVAAASVLVAPAGAQPAVRPASVAGTAAMVDSTAAAPEPVLPPQTRAQATSPASAALPPALTAEQRREWPQLAVGGSVWSDTPSARFVILGGQVVREGDTTADGVLVERITPKAVVLRWRDQRGSLAF